MVYYVSCHLRIQVLAIKVNVLNGVVQPIVYTLKKGYSTKTGSDHRGSTLNHIVARTKPQVM